MTMLVVTSMFILFYFELLGQSANSLLKIKSLPFNFVTGFLCFLGINYLLTGLLSGFNFPFIYILVIDTTMLIIGFYLIIKERNNIKINFKWYEIIALVIMSLISLYYSYNTTLGDLHGFDSVHYINMVSGAINSQNGLYNYHSVFGYTNGIGATMQYSFQSYYSFCSVIIFYVVSFFNFLNKVVLYNSAFIWIFQIIFTISLMSIFVNSYRLYLNNKPVLSLLLLIVNLFYFSKLYFYSVFGFFGNSFRIITASYVMMIVIRYFKERNSNDRLLISLFLLSGCAFTSSYLFICILFLFSYCLVAVEIDDYIFKWASLTVAMPLINFALFQGFKFPLVIFFVVLVIITAFITNDRLVVLFRKNLFKKIVVLVAAFVMLLMSYKTTGNLFDFSAFFNNNSEVADMTIDYFSLIAGKYVKICILIGMLLFLIINSKDKYAMMLWIIIIAVFNPFCCSFLNKINAVYYRAYDAFLNPFTLIYFYSSIYESIKIKTLSNIALVVLLVFVNKNINYKMPDYYHEDLFKPKDNYNRVNKMTYSEYDVIVELKQLIDYTNLDNPLICTPNILTFSSIADGRYIYGRCYWKPNYNSASKMVHAIFFPVDYYGQEIYYEHARPEGEIDYRNCVKYLKESGVDILVISKNLDFYDDEKDVYYPLRYVVEWELEYPDYENEDYCIYLINRM